VKIDPENKIPTLGVFLRSKDLSFLAGFFLVRMEDLFDGGDCVRMEGLFASMNVVVREEYNWCLFGTLRCDIFAQQRQS